MPASGGEIPMFRHELPETGVPTTLVFERGTDGNVYLDGCQVSITLLT